MSAQSQIELLYREAQYCDNSERLFQIASELQNLGAWDYADVVRKWAYESTHVEA